MSTAIETRVVLGAAFLLSTATALGLFGPYPGYRGQPELQRLIVVYLLPVTAAIIAALIASLQRRRLPAQDNGSADAAIQAIVFWVSFFLIGVHVILIGALVDANWVRQPIASRGVVLLLGVSIAATGNLLPRTRPNMAFGIRTSRTLADRQVWMLTHRVCGYACVAVGIVTIAAALFLRGEQIAAVPAVAVVVATASIFGYYRRAARPASLP